MMYVMPLAITDLSGSVVAVVTAPFALRRGGASPVALVSFVGYQKL